MRLLLLTHTFNSLAQRLYVELSQRGHELSVEFDIHDAVTREAVDRFAPDVVLAPYLKRAIPEAVWRRVPCLVVHPGVAGDRGPAALDWAIMNQEPRWGVTVLQANEVLDGGDVWATAEFAMRPARKSSLYRNEVTQAAVRAVLDALERLQAGGRPRPQDAAVSRPWMAQAVRAIDWERDDTTAVLRKIHAADGFPGVRDTVRGVPCFLYGGHEEASWSGRVPGEVLAQWEGAICRATRDGAVWITHLRTPRGLKLPAAAVLGDRLDGVPERRGSYGEIRYEEAGGVGYLWFDFYNGAMSAEQCRRLRDAWLQARERDTRVIVLMGGEDFWSNGIHLLTIEAADSPADESWRNIEAMNDLAEAILTTESHLTVAALQGNAGAGGVFLALAADRVMARRGVVLNPHYKNMGNLYGSEYWTYLLPRRVGEARARDLTEQRLPLGAAGALASGLLDECFGEDAADFRRGVKERAQAMASDAGLPARLAAKAVRRRRDEEEKALAAYRAEEMEHMKLNFYGFDPSYHVARYRFVHRVPHAWTPLHLAVHRTPVGQS